MAVMGHHEPLLPLYLAKRILTTVHLKYLHNINPKQQQQPLVDLLFLIFLSVKINPLEVLTNSFISVVSILKTSPF